MHSAFTSSHVARQLVWGPGHSLPSCELPLSSVFHEVCDVELAEAHQLETSHSRDIHYTEGTNHLYLA